MKYQHFSLYNLEITVYKRPLVLDNFKEEAEYEDETRQYENKACKLMQE